MKCPVKHHRLLRFLMTTCKATGSLRFAVACVMLFVFIIPSNAHALLGKFTVKDEYELGRQFDILVRSRMPLVEDPEVKSYILSLVTRLAESIPPQPFAFNANVLLHNSINAFAVPGGYVFVNTGLIMAMEHESDLVGVLAHELAHVTQRHIADRIERSQVTTLGSVAGALAGALLGGDVGAGVMVGAMAANQSSMLNYSRINETDADQMGLQYMTKAGFNPYGLKRAFETIRREQWTTGIDIPEYLSTHPDVIGRIAEVHNRIQTFHESIQKRPENDTAFLRVRTLVQARYGELSIADHYLNKLDPNNAVTLMGKGLVAERRNRFTDAQGYFEKALQKAPGDSLVIREAGRFYYAKGDPKAGALLQKALKLAPDDIMAQFFFARLLNDKKSYAQAHKYYKQILRFLPQDSEVHYYYGRSLGEAGFPFDAYLHLAYGALYQNQKPKVESWLKRAKNVAATPTAKQTAQLKDFEKKYKERREFWK